MSTPDNSTSNMSDSRDEIELSPAYAIVADAVKLDPDYYWYNTHLEFENLNAHFYTVATERKSPNNSGGQGWKSFEHYKARRSKFLGGAGPFACSGQNYPVGAYQLGTWTGTRTLAYGWKADGNRVNPFGEPGLPVQGLPEYVVEQANGSFLPDPPDLNGMTAIAMRKMLPTIKQEMSLINSIIELKDFKSLAATSAKAAALSVRQGLTLAQKFRRGYGSMRRWLRSRPSEATAAGIYLQLQFNILPLISDVMAVRRAIANTEEQVRKLVNRAGKPQRTHFTMRPIEGDDAIDYSADQYYLVDPVRVTAPFAQWQICRLGRKVLNSPSVFHTELEYSYSYKSWQVEHAQLLGMLDAFGVNLNPAIIWNAVPWSFVVDWLVGVSRYLNDRKVLNMEPQINIRRFLWSYIRSREVYTWADVSRSFTPSTTLPALPESLYPKGVTLPMTREISYKRRVGLPSASSLETSGVNLSELTLGSALAVARRRNPKRSR